MGARNIVVVPYNPRWPQIYSSEAARLAPAFEALLVGLHHIGSTAIPGCHAKPIIDILGVVTDIEAVEACNRAMTALGDEPRGENGIPGRRYFVRSRGGSDMFHLHTFQQCNPEIDRHLDFAAYLAAHPGGRRLEVAAGPALPARYRLLHRWERGLYPGYRPECPGLAPEKRIRRQALTPFGTVPGGDPTCRGQGGRIGGRLRHEQGDQVGLASLSQVPEAVVEPTLQPEHAAYGWSRTG